MHPYPIHQTSSLDCPLELMTKVLHSSHFCGLCLFILYKSLRLRFPDPAGRPLSSGFPDLLQV